MKLTGNLLPRRKRTRPARDERAVTDLLAGVPARDFPYQDLTETQLAAYRFAAASEQPPVPRFYPAPAAVAQTRAMPELKPEQLSASVTVPAAVADAALLRQVLDGLHAARPGANRAQSFIADKKDLPLFGALTKERGWLGLHADPKPFGWQRMSTEIWSARERALADAAFASARQQLAAEFDAVQAGIASGRPLGGGA